MDWNRLWNNLLGDERLLANLVAVHAVLLALLFASMALRKLLKHGGQHFVRITGLHLLDGLSREATRGLRSMVFWATLALMAATAAAGVAYHLAGRDPRVDVVDWYHHLTAQQLVAFGLLLGKIVLATMLVLLAFRAIRRLRVFLEAYVHHHLPKHVPAEAPAGVLPHGDRPVPERRLDHEATIKGWFQLVERSLTAAAVLVAAWTVAHLAELHPVESGAVLCLSILGIVTVARLLTLSGRTLSFLLADQGNRHLGRGQFSRYWERVTRLFPFGERCFETAVYISAASLCVKELHFVAFVADYGTNLVKCIGLFFGTRVVIELLSVFINEAFGMYDENRPVDQKGLTLVPLLQSISQYTLYFGSALFMLRVFEVDTTPILAGAGILGLAGGLGAQSLVTDVVSGFFILFENQYLVGDIVQIGDAIGRVEAISIRHTQIRDEQGKLFILPNGQIKSVTNFSKGYVNAVVDIKVPTSTNLEHITRDMTEAGRRLRLARREVLGETVVKGLVELTPSDMVVRAVTRVDPGSNQAMAREYRRILKEVFDERAQRKTAELPAYAA